MADLAAAARRFVQSPAYSELTLRQLALLCVVADDEGPHHVRHLAKTLGVSKPVVTRAVHLLARRGLLKRQRRPDDRRDVVIAATEAGRDLRDWFRNPQSGGHHG